jgi:hypothetical protein
MGSLKVLATAASMCSAIHSSTQDVALSRRKQGSSPLGSASQINGLAQFYDFTVPFLSRLCFTRNPEVPPAARPLPNLFAASAASSRC